MKEDILFNKLTQPARFAIARTAMVSLQLLPTLGEGNYCIEIGKLEKLYDWEIVYISWGMGAFSFVLS